ncbi:unnamed protein product [marine sediment metagenome]|uniref:Uncharacterized protein n=1 Tax=marine sediment metagenome TaxID=412755 RepID=X1UBX7_9ZZZZ
MRDHFRKQRQRRYNHSKPFTPRPISIIQQPRVTNDTPIRNNNSGGSNQPPTFNYNIFNTAPKVDSQPKSQNKTKTKDFDLGLFLILTAIVGVFMWIYDSGFRSVTSELIQKGLGQLTLIDSATAGLLGVLVIVLIIYLVSKRK